MKKKMMMMMKTKVKVEREVKYLGNLRKRGGVKTREEGAFSTMISKRKQPKKERATVR